MKTFLLLIGIISVVFGVKFVFDARPIIKRYFTNSNTNESSFMLKGLGFALLILGSILIYLYY